MVFKINHLGKVKSSFMLDPQILEEARIAATRRHSTISNTMEEALIGYLKLTDIKVRREHEQNQQEEEHRKHLEELRQQQQHQQRQNQIDKEFHRMTRGRFSNF